MDAEILQNLHHQARPYQLVALEKWQRALETDTGREWLFQMATGSGKTFVMAAIMLDLFRHGYRNFIFFVNSTNILAKTRDNFINLESPKYLFAPEIILGGRHIQIREVRNFADQNPNAINILFTTTQRLHSDLAHPHENRLTYYDFAEQDIVLLGDEAHHNNAQSMRDKNDESWEKTLQNIRQINPKTWLLEFTATMDFDDAAIAKKYADRVVYRYDLSQFYAERYSKEVLIYEAAESLPERMLAAMVISEYRKLVAEKFGLNVKPVILFKSRTILENRKNYLTLLKALVDLKPMQLEDMKTKAAGILAQAFEFLDAEKIDLMSFTTMLQKSFGPEHILQIDGGRPVSARDQHLVNTLENPENPVRAILAVDMLKEGWDVLNLFDIVRLYETHDGAWKNGKYLPGKTTISEAQLIGRGARYCPFEIESVPSDTTEPSALKNAGRLGALNGAEKFRRKFDNEPENPLKVLEQLHYHTTRAVSYIDEIKITLDQTGLTNFAHKKRPLAKSTSEFLLKQRSEVPKITNFPVRILARVPKSVSELFDEKHMAQNLRIGWQEKFTPNLVYAAMNARPQVYNFAKLKAKGYKSRAEFVEKLAQAEIVIEDCRDFNELTQEQKLEVVKTVLLAI